MADLLTAHKLRQAIEFLDDLADGMGLAQRRLDEAIIKLARNHDVEAYWEAPLNSSPSFPARPPGVAGGDEIVLTEGATLPK